MTALVTTQSRNSQMTASVIDLEERKRKERKKPTILFLVLLFFSFIFCVVLSYPLHDHLVFAAGLEFLVRKDHTVADHHLVANLHILTY